MTNLTVTVDDAHLASISTVARALAAKGMRVDRVLAAVGCITGSFPSALTASVTSALRSVPGVASIDPRVAFRTAPPDSDIQ